jgi:regulator of nucleoside diphosphate kinase
MTASLIVTDADAAILGMIKLNEPLRRELERAVIVASEAVPPDVATMNSQVRYMDETEGVTRVVALVYPPAARGGQAMVSVLAPVGSALLGLAAGQAIEWDFPDGSRRRLRLEAVLYQPERERRKAPARARKHRSPETFP